MTNNGKPCCFFDRDGIVNVDPAPKRYVETISNFLLLPAFIEALRVVSDKGYEAVIVTNQKGVGTGQVKPRAIAQMHDYLLKRIRVEGLTLRDILVCTATDDAHTHRKPNPGMLLEAAAKHGLDLARSWMIGDSERDILAGQRAGCRTVLVGAKECTVKPDFHVPDLDQLAPLLQTSLPQV